MSESRTPREDFDRILSLSRRALKRWWLPLAGLVAGGLLGFLLGHLKTPIYESETLLLYRDATPVTLSQGQSDGTRDLATRVGDLLMTRQRFEAIIRELNLYPDVVSSDGMPAAADHMRRDTTFQPHGTGSTFLIRYRSSSPELAQKVTDRLAQTLIQDDGQLRSEQANVTSEFLAGERDRLEADLRAKERTLAEFLADHPEFAQDDGEGAGAAVRATTAPLVARDPDVDARLFTLSRQRERIQARLSTSAKTPVATGPDASAMSAIAAVDAARRELDEAQRFLEQKRATYTAQHPDVVSGTERVAAAKRKLAAAQAAAPAPSARIDPSQLPPLTPAERADLMNRLAEIDDQITATRRSGGPAIPTPPTGKKPPPDPNGLVALETDWARINREVSEARERAQVLESRRFAAQIAAASEVQGQATRLRVIDPATVPSRPIGAGRRALIAISAMAVAAIGLIIAFLLAWLDDRVYKDSDIERLVVVPFLVYVPAKMPRTGRLRLTRGSAPDKPNEGDPPLS